MSHLILGLDPEHRALAQVEDITMGHFFRWLAAGWKDLRSAPAASMGYGVLFVIASYLITIAVVLNQWFYLLLPLLAGFFLVAPALGHRLGAGGSTPTQCWRAVFRRLPRAVGAERKHQAAAIRATLRRYRGACTLMSSDSVRVCRPNTCASSSPSYLQFAAPWYGKSD